MVKKKSLDYAKAITCWCELNELPAPIFTHKKDVHGPHDVFLFDDGNNIVDGVVVNNGTEIGHWGEALGPQPTEEQLEDALKKCKKKSWWQFWRRT